MDLILSYSDHIFELEDKKLKKINMRNTKNIALLMGNNSYVGREYASRLIIQNVNFDILIFGKKLTNKIDIDRVKNFWKPKSQSQVLKKRNSIFLKKSIQEK